MTFPTLPDDPCPFCGNKHAGTICPLIASITYSADGTAIVGVSFKDPAVEPIVYPPNPPEQAKGNRT